jgi:predicted helicase
VDAFEQVLQKYRDTSFSERDKGYRFERLMQSFLKTYPLYDGQFTSIWLWNEFPSRTDFGSGDKDLGIDLVTRTKDGDYWAVQCKCYQEDALIDKPKVDTFLSTSGKSFYDTLEAGKKANFAYRLWIDTTKKGFNREAENTIQGQTPPVGRLGYYDLISATVDWQKLDEGLSGKKAAVKKYEPLLHQQTAISEVHNYLKKNDRGKLIMACGTGKTFTSLRIAEKEINSNPAASGNGLVLFLVPSIALLGQTLREWKNQCVKPIYAICICSDTGVSKSDDAITATVTDLALPASTNIKNITRQFEAARNSQKTEGGNIVVFSTYQSIDVISEVQKTINRQRKNSFLFDLVICDEAHRTTGVILSGGDESAFIKVHDDKFIKAKKRIYMTATPRIYSEAAQKKAKEAFATLCSMDDPAMYGEEMYRIGFGEAVDKQLLSDYKVIVLTVEENQLDKKLENSIKEKSKEVDIEINTEDTLKIIGCINALSKKSLADKEIFEGVDPAPMRSAVAFCQNIAVSKATAQSFNICRDVYFSILTEEQRAEIVVVEAAHVDGTMGAQTREQKLHWLKSADPAKRECNILNNVRCLSEGVDVPSLDAVMFLSARNSQIDVVQSVGRVMRKAEGKKYGYIIIPVVVLPEADPDKVLSSDRFKVVWTVLNALRAHDDRFDATINKIELNKKKPGQIGVTGTNIGGKDTFDDDDVSGTGSRIKSEFEKQMELEFAKLQGLIYARIVKKCGTKPYWEEWAKDVAKIAERHIEQITAIVNREGKARQEFEKYIAGLRKNINPSVTKEDAIEMLAQHIITRPVFEALFEDYSFVKNNTVSKSLQGIIDALNEQSKKEDAQKLERFYVSVQQKAEGIDNGEAKQKIIVELYDKFFRTAFPKVTEKLGIVYTPVEIVDFIIHSVEDVLQKEFGRSMSDENVHILDPFTGTGTFISRLLQSGIIRNEDLERKYTREIHANEIVLLAYYIASINIENVYHDLLKITEPYNVVFYPEIEYEAADDVIQFPGTKAEKKGDEEYTPFPGICLTDTFQLGESKEGENLFSEIFPQNSQRVQEQQKTPLRIIIGNPPYSVGQKSANDDAQNQAYPKLEAIIAKTYAAHSTATNKNSLYDTYIKAFRWSTDRLDPVNGGIICFVSNGTWIGGNALAGFRSHLGSDFSSVYVFNLRGNCRTSGELRQKEAGNVFGLGSRTPISITLLVKNPKQKTEKAAIHYYDIGDYLSREKKLEVIKHFSTVNNMDWGVLSPDKHNDWVNFRNDAFSSFIPIEPDEKFNIVSKSFFIVNSRGIETARDAWVYNSSQETLLRNMKNHISFYNCQVNTLKKLIEKDPNLDFDNFRDNSPDKISWSSSLIDNFKRLKNAKFEKEKISEAIYRPFFKQYLYSGDKMIHRRGQFEQFFSNSYPNHLICVHGLGGKKDFSVIVTNSITDLNTLEAGTQCFPLYWYEKKEKVQGGLFERVEDEYIRHDAISDFILDQGKTRYGPRVTKEDIFYYVYGILHSPEYQKTFANDLKKMLPRLPLVEKPADFWAFADAGRKLADLHLNYEDQKKPKEVIVNGTEKGIFTVDKMRFGLKKWGKSKWGEGKFGETQKNEIIYNAYINISNIPAKAYDYVVNGKSAIEWVMERYAVTTHKESGIRNDPNDWAREHDNPQYILDLLFSVINVSMKTVDIVAGLPRVE